MASLHKDPRGKSPYWYAVYRTATGKRVFKSTKRRSHREALEVVLNLERAEKEAALGRLTESRTRELFNETMERAGGKLVQRMTVQGWFTKWLDEKVADGGIGENSRIAYSATIRHFLQHLELVVNFED